MDVYEYTQLDAEDVVEHKRRQDELKALEEKQKRELKLKAESCRFRAGML